jgi:ABC-type amino acid transport substrate-binding protein
MTVSTVQLRSKTCRKTREAVVGSLGLGAKLPAGECGGENQVSRVCCFYFIFRRGIYMKKLWVLMCVLVLAVGVLAAGCGGSDTKKDAGAKPAPSKKELIVGTEPSFAPFEFPKENSKEFTGFDIELIQAIAKDMGYEKCTIANMGFDALIPALDAGNIDVAIAGMTITDARAQKVNFSKPYYKSGLAVVVSKDSNIKGVEDLKGKKIAAQLGTTGAMRAEKIEGAKVTSFDTNNLACLELKNHAVDAVIGDLPVEQYFLKTGGSAYAKIVGPTLTAEDYGIAVAKKNTELVKNIDKSLENLKKNGEFDKLYQKWFGVSK